jgi:hypothetical protein
VSVDADAARQFAETEPVASPRSVLEGSLPVRYAAQGSARVVAEEPERVVVEAAVEGSGPGLLVLSDQVAPGWSADVDGAPADIVPANLLARGVWVPRGVHVVTFRYLTPGLLEGVAIAVCAALVLAGWAWVHRNRVAPSHGQG